MSVESRYERKFDAGTEDPARVATWLRAAAPLARAFEDRDVLSLYFDDAAHRSYAENKAGAEDRAKVRLRAYRTAAGLRGPLRLERKIKSGALSHKHVTTLDAPRLDEDLRLSLASLDAVPMGLRSLVPTLFVRYRRSYFKLTASRVRLTIDRDIEVRSASGGHGLRLSHTVVEVKYAPEDEDLADPLMAQLPYRLSRYSKYVTGLSAALRAST